MDNIEARLKEITHKNCFYRDKECPITSHPDCMECEEDIRQICQLFKPKFNNVLEADAHNWDTRELQPKPDMLDKCKCGHTFEEHDWGAWEKGEAGCLVTDEDEKLCQCEQFEPKPSESRLLHTTEDFAPFKTIHWEQYGDTTINEVDFDLVGIAKAQRDLTASTKDLECQQKIETIYNPDYLDFKKGVAAEKEPCQARVERIKREITENAQETEINGELQWFIPSAKMEALWKEEGI